LTQKDKLLLCLAVDDVEHPKVGLIIRDMLARVGLPEARHWNVDEHLTYIQHTEALVTRYLGGWLLTSPGQDFVRERVRQALKPRKAKVASSLRAHLDNITDPRTKAFVEEAVDCFEHELHRAAVVLSWVGAVSVLQQHVIDNQLNAFNNEASKRNEKWKTARTRDDLGRMRDFDFLDILEAIAVIGHSTKLRLKQCLQLRNSCSHPSSLKVGENEVIAHIDALILNVFSRF
jgi:hypothetical protein